MDPNPPTHLHLPYPVKLDNADLNKNIADGS